MSCESLRLAESYLREIDDALERHMDRMEERRQAPTPEPELSERSAQLHRKLIQFIDCHSYNHCASWSFRLYEVLPNDVIAQAFAPFENDGFRFEHTVEDWSPILWDWIKVTKTPPNWKELMLNYQKRQAESRASD